MKCILTISLVEYNTTQWFQTKLDCLVIGYNIRKEVENIIESSLNDGKQMYAKFLT